MSDVRPAGTIEFSTSAFSIDAVKRAAYALMDRAAVSIDVHDRAIRCLVVPAKGSNLDDVLDALRREVLDQDLRIVMEEQTSGVRSVVLGLAFSRTGLQDV